MEYNLLRTFETNFGFSGENDIFSDDLILPGIGQILNFNSVIMPLHNAFDLTKIEKQNDFEIELEQSGAGNEIDSEDSAEITSETNGEKDMGLENKSEVEESELNLNERKRKQLDPSIYESFMHPKMFKTHKIVLDEKSNVKKSKTVSKQQKSPTSTIIQNDTVKKIKHKFNVY